MQKHKFGDKWLSITHQFWRNGRNVSPREGRGGHERRARAREEKKKQTNRKAEPRSRKNGDGFPRSFPIEIPEDRGQAAFISLPFPRLASPPTMTNY